MHTKVKTSLTNYSKVDKAGSLMEKFALHVHAVGPPMMEEVMLVMVVGDGSYGVLQVEGVAFTVS